MSEKGIPIDGAKSQIAFTSQHVIMTPVIGPAERTDVVELERLFAKILNELPYNNALSKEREASKYTAKSLEMKIADDQYSVLVAKTSDGDRGGRGRTKIIGFCLNHFDDYTIWLEWFGVDENARRKGLGEALLKKTFETAKKRRAHKVWCDCRTTNTPSRNLLSKAGFQPIATVRNHWYGQDFILWDVFV